MNKDIIVLVEHFNGQLAEITHTLMAQARIVTASTGGSVMAVLLGSGAASLASGLAADMVLLADHANLKNYSYDAYLSVLAPLMSQKQPHLILLGDTTIGSEVAGGLSARLGLPVVSFCLSLSAEDSQIKFLSQVCGGKLAAEGALPESTVIITMLPGKVKNEPAKANPAPVIQSLPVSMPSAPRMTLDHYIQPESGDVDITGAEFLVGVGRGIQNQDNIELAQGLADALGGALCATRPVIDQNWLPATRQVGKSGKSIKPRGYLALGISGAPEHTEGITGSSLIIAANTDPAAPIFNVAQYGAVVDILDLIPALTDQIKLAKGG